MGKTIAIVIGVLVFGMVIIGLQQLIVKQSLTNSLKTAAPSQAAVSSVSLYRTTLPGADSAGRVVTLDTKSDKTATFTQDYQNGEAPIVETGTWTEGENRGVTVTLDKKGETPLPEPTVMVFTFSDLNAGVLTLQEPQEAGFGSEGLVMQNILPWVNKKWMWSKTVMSDGATTQANREKGFSITFVKEGSAHITTDCNNGNGAYTLTSETGMVIGPVATTMMYCEGSQETVFYQQINNIDSYLYKDGQLHLLLKFDSGTMTFE